MTLARFFISLRTKSGYSLRELAGRAKPKVDPVTPWKIEAGKPVRAKTLGQVLRGLGLKESDPEFIQAFALWSTEQARSMPFGVVDAGMARTRKSNDREFDRLVNAAAAALKAAPESDRPLIIEALKHPAALALWVRSRK